MKRGLKSFFTVIFLFVLMQLLADGIAPEGAGTSVNPYQIANLDNLLWLSTNTSAWAQKYIVQTADIDASETSNWNNGEGFIPIGNNTNSFFISSYNGQGHIIDGLVINRPNEDFQGMFGLTFLSTITNLGLTDLNVTGKDIVGGLVSDINSANISKCYVIGTITGNTYVGGFASYAPDNQNISIEDCYSRCNVRATINTGFANAGGFLSYFEGYRLVRCYSAGTVSADGPRVGAFAGYVDIYWGGEYLNNYCEITEGVIAGIGNGDTDGLTELSTTQMQNQTSYEGWDFETVWEIDGVNNDGYPYLEWEDYPLPVTLSSFTASYENQQPVLHWVTQSEQENSGWNLYRNTLNDVANSFKLNNVLISGAETSTEIHSYTYNDEYEVLPGRDYYYWLESISLSGVTDNFGPVTLRIPEEEGDNIPEILDKYGLIDCHPNPFNPLTTITFAVQVPCIVSLEIFNVKGQMVNKLFSQYIDTDQINKELVVKWYGDRGNKQPVSSGMYSVVMKYGDFIDQSKLLLLK